MHKDEIVIKIICLKSANNKLKSGYFCYKKEQIAKQATKRLLSYENECVVR